jgi:hypothetical protein
MKNSCNGMFNPLNAELNPICHLLALLGGATIVDVSRLRVNLTREHPTCSAVPQPTAPPRAPTVRETSSEPANMALLAVTITKRGFFFFLPYRASNVTGYVVMSQEILRLVLYIRGLTLNRSLDFTVALFSRRLDYYCIYRFYVEYALN